MEVISEAKKTKEGSNMITPVQKSRLKKHGLKFDGEKEMMEFLHGKIAGLAPYRRGWLITFIEDIEEVTNSDLTEALVQTCVVVLGKKAKEEGR